MEGIVKLRGMGAEELAAKEIELRDQLFRLRFQMAMGQTESIRRLRELRRDIARIQTLQREREATQATQGARS